VADNDDPPADTLFGGYGYCDQHVRLFMALAQQAGLATRETFLIRQPDGISPHTVAEVYLGGRWEMVDVFYDYVAKRHDGSPATMQDVVATSDPIIGLAGLQPSDYQNARIQLEWHPNRLANWLWGHVPGWLADRAQDLYLRLPPPTLPAADASGREYGLQSPDGAVYWKARNYELFGRAAAAQAEYHRLLSAFPDGAFADDARYNLSLMELDGAPAASISLASQLDDADTTPALQQDARYLLGTAYEHVGGAQACASALGIFQDLAGALVIDSPAALRQLNHSPCSSGNHAQPLARFGPLTLQAARLDGGGVLLVWQADAHMARDYTIFVHALDGSGQVIAQHDSQPAMGALPTSKMRLNEVIADRHPLVIPRDAEQLEIGAYLLSTGKRLGEPNGQDALRLPVEVGSAPGEAVAAA